MSQAAGHYETWHRDTAREAPMEEAHRPLWRHFIETIPEADLSTREVLDFGCNRGGFLRLLYALKPFKHAVGVDVASASIAAARDLAGLAPIDYKVASDLSAWPAQFDLAFSNEVIYLLPDIAAHAAEMHAALRKGGVYYAVTGCHTDSPSGLPGAESSAKVPTLRYMIDHRTIMLPPSRWRALRYRCGASATAASSRSQSIAATTQN